MKLSLFSFFIFFCFSMMLVSCNSSETTENQIVGKWEYSKMDKKSGDTSPGKVKELNERNKGLTILFDKDGGFTPSTDNKKGSYVLINEGDYLVTRIAGIDRGDTLKIITLNNNDLTVETPDKDVIYFIRVK